MFGSGVLIRSMVRTIFRVAALFVFAIIVFATLAPLNARPGTGHVGFERVAAYVLLGLTLTVGFPNRFWVIVLSVLVIAIGLEVAQHLTLDRHGRAIDAVEKVGGSAIGVFGGYILNRFAKLCPR